MRLITVALGLALALLLPAAGVMAGYSDGQYYQDGPYYGSGQGKCSASGGFMNPCGAYGMAGGLVSTMMGGLCGQTPCGRPGGTGPCGNWWGSGHASPYWYPYWGYPYYWAHCYWGYPYQCGTYPYWWPSYPMWYGQPCTSDSPVYYGEPEQNGY